MSMLKTQIDLKELYEKDFVEWSEKMAELIKNKEFDLVDWENLLEEVKDMGHRHLESAISYLAIILEHLYKIDNFKKNEDMGKSWVKSIENSKDMINALFEDYPSLKTKLPENIQRAWRYASVGIRKWLRDNDLNPEDFNIPKDCPYTYNEAMNRF